jgi:hypothetical protein
MLDPQLPAALKRCSLLATAWQQLDSGLEEQGLRSAKFPEWFEAGVENLQRLLAPEENVDVAVLLSESR